MKLSLSLLLSVASADLLPNFGGSVGARVTNPTVGGCPKITCVMFCKDGQQKDAKGCDICSCVRNIATGGKLATGTGSCQRDVHGCCAELGVAWCPEKGMCLSTSASAVISCSSWAGNPPQTAASASSSVALPPPTFQRMPPMPPAQSGGLLGGSGLLGVNVGLGLGRPASSPVLATSTSVNAGLSGNTMSSGNSMSTGNSMSSGSATGSVSTGLSLGLSAPAPPGQCGENCYMYCPNGYVKDARGCPTCKCAGPAGTCPTMDCGSRSCVGGYAKDTNGCPTCICLSGSFTNPTLSDTTGKPVTVTPPVVATVNATAKPEKPATKPEVQADALVAMDRPTISLNPCKPSPCKSSQKCVPAPKQCVQAPCPQYTCVKPKKKDAKKSAAPTPSS